MNENRVSSLKNAKPAVSGWGGRGIDGAERGENLQVWQIQYQRARIRGALRDGLAIEILFT